MPDETPAAPWTSSLFPLVLGGNVFGWTADDATSFALLDAFAEAAAADGRPAMVDTADVYSVWAPGNTGGESEALIGRWIAARRPANLLVATKVAKHPRLCGLAEATVREALDASRERLGLDVVDLYYAHENDAARTTDDIAGLFGALVADGSIAAWGLSNIEPDRVAAIVAAADRLGTARPVVDQSQYNLMEREPFETRLRPVLDAAGMVELPYYGLAKGFLTGKYRSTDAAGGPEGPRAASASAYLDDRGRRVLDALDQVARAHGVTPAATALAWLAARPTVLAPIASARTVDQLDALLASARVRLSDADVESLCAASR
jgi:aryl-alcohol dehydrogenase-like predicted oxidoreductase